jgi:hypothetical protein
MRRNTALLIAAILLSVLGVSCGDDDSGDSAPVAAASPSPSPTSSPGPVLTYWSSADYENFKSGCVVNDGSRTWSAAYCGCLYRSLHPYMTAAQYFSNADAAMKSLEASGAKAKCEADYPR